MGKRTFREGAHRITVVMKDGGRYYFEAPNPHATFTVVQGVTIVEIFRDWESSEKPGQILASFPMDNIWGVFYSDAEKG